MSGDHALSSTPLWDDFFRALRATAHQSCGMAQQRIFHDWYNRALTLFGTDTENLLLFQLYHELARSLRTQGGRLALLETDVQASLNTLMSYLSHRSHYSATSRQANAGRGTLRLRRIRPARALMLDLLATIHEPLGQFLHASDESAMVTDTPDVHEAPPQSAGNAPSLQGTVTGVNPEGMAGVIVLPTRDDGDCFFDSVCQAVGARQASLPVYTMFANPTALRQALALAVVANFDRDDQSGSGSGSGSADNPFPLTMAAHDYWTMQCLCATPESYAVPHTVVRLGTPATQTAKILSAQGTAFRYLILQLYLWLRMLVVDLAMTRILQLVEEGYDGRDFCSAWSAWAHASHEGWAHTVQTVGVPGWDEFYQVTKPVHLRHDLKQDADGQFEVSPANKGLLDWECNYACYAICQRWAAHELGADNVVKIGQSYAAYAAPHEFFAVLSVEDLAKCLSLTEHWVGDDLLFMDRSIVTTTTRLLFAVYDTMLQPQAMQEGDPAFTPTRTFEECSWLVPWTIARALRPACHTTPASVIFATNPNVRWSVPAHFANIGADLLTAYHHDLRASMRTLTSLQLADMMQDRRMWGDQHVLEILRHQCPWLYIHVWHLELVDTLTVRAGGTVNLANMRHVQSDGARPTLDKSRTPSVHIHLLLQNRHYQLLAFDPSAVGSTTGTQGVHSGLQYGGYTPPEPYESLSASLGEQEATNGLRVILTGLDEQEHERFLAQCGQHVNRPYADAYPLCTLSP